MRQWLRFGEKSTRDFGIYISGIHTFNAPSRKVEKFDIPGRNGQLTIDSGTFNNISVLYPCFILDSFQDNIEAWRSYALSQKGYKRLEDTYHPGQYRLAVYSEEVTVDTYGYLSTQGTFDMVFDCKPQRYLKSGDIPVEIDHEETIYNRTHFQAKPLLRCYGNGTFSIGHEVITVNTSKPYIDIDCDMMDAFYGSENCNSDIEMSSGEFPVLDPGENGIDPGDLTKIIITPRWWTL